MIQTNEINKNILSNASDLLVLLILTAYIVSSVAFNLFRDIFPYNISISPFHRAFMLFKSIVAAHDAVTLSAMNKLQEEEHAA